MKKMQILFLSITTAVLFDSCTASKPASSPAPAPVVAVAPAVKSPDGIYAPGKDELAAIQTRNPNATMEHLTEGYLLYTKGACVNCHGPENIYKFSQTQWVHIVNDMAQKANISESQKAAVYAYILSIKDNQPK